MSNQDKESFDKDFQSQEAEDIETGRKEGKKVETEMEKCTSCGSNMRFDPETQSLICDHCGNNIEFASFSQAKELEFSEEVISKGEKWNSDETAVFSCDNCGAKVVLSTGETAKVCPFCGTPHAQKSEELDGLKPNALIPFAISTEKAVECGKRWAKKRLFAPRKFKKNIKTDSVNGVYMPCFTFDSHTHSFYVGRIGKTYTRTVGSGKNRRTQTYIVWRNISGTFSEDFDDVLINAGKKMEQKRLDKIAPYDTQNGKEYNEQYLLGFMAYHYDEDVTTYWDRAKKIIDERLKKDILNQYSYDVVDYLNVSTKHENVTYKYVMLPVYVGNFKFKQKLFNFFVNGETGKVSGKTPISAWRVLIAVLLGLGALVGIGFLCYTYLLK